MEQTTAQIMKEIRKASKSVEEAKKYAKFFEDAGVDNASYRIAKEQLAYDENKLAKLVAKLI